MSQHKTKVGNPDDDCIANGAKYFFQINRGGRHRSGKVYDEHGALVWRYAARKDASGWLRRNPLIKPDFVFTEANGPAELVIRRISFFPSRFEIRDKDAVVGRVCNQSIFQIKYSIEIAGTGSWKFLLALFTVRFRGKSPSGTDIWVLVGPSGMEWSVLIRPGIDDRRLVASLAFIHNQYWNYG
jgi:hypothetical protein